MKQQGHAVWLFGAVLIAGVWTVSACGEDASVEDPGAGGSSSGSTTTGGSSGDIGTSSGASSGTTSSGGSSGTTSSGDGGSSGTATGATPANFKVAFIGDTDQGSEFTSVLKLIKAENAQLVVVQGDLTYDFHSADSWIKAADAELQSGTTKIPYIAAKGNHDWDWSISNGLGDKLNQKLTDWAITTDDNKPKDVSYSLTYKGLKLVFVGDSGSQTTRATYVKDQLANDKAIWRVCGWHKNMRATNVGDKKDEMSWPIYDNCRAAGAIVAQGHSHTYSRSKTISDDEKLTVDTGCSDPFALCVGPGKHFFFDSSLGGTGLRDLDDTYKAKPYFAASDSANFGALFIEFNVDNDPRKAKGYFKSIDNTIVDPPAGSGKTFFTITSSN
jgi:hypothetical protein